MTDPREPSWWKYIAGRDADKKWSAFYASTAAKGGTFSERDLGFYLNAIDRLAADSYESAAHRPVDPLNFWLVCHFQLGIAGKSRKAASCDTEALAQSVGRAKGHTYKQIQRHASELEIPASEFLAAIWGDLPVDWSTPAIGASVLRALTAFVERQVRKVA